MKPRGRPSGSHPRTLVASLGLLALLSTSPAWAKGQEEAGPAAAPGLSALETQRLFDAYVLVQAQDHLGLTEEQLPDFVTRLKALQEARRRQLQERRKILLELQRLSNPNAPRRFNEARVRSLLRSLGELDASAVEVVRKAQEALDQTLDLRQRARFRVFEEQVERRKLDLLLRARRAAAGAVRQAPRRDPDQKKRP